MQHIVPDAGPEEAAAIAAAIQRFVADTTPLAAPEPVAPSGWLLAARREAVSRDPHDVT